MLSAWAGSPSVLAQAQETPVPEANPTAIAQTPQPGNLMDAFLKAVSQPDIQSVLQIGVAIVGIIFSSIFAIFKILNDKFNNIHTQLQDAVKLATEAKEKANNYQFLSEQIRLIYPQAVQQRMREVSFDQAYTALEQGEMSRREFIEYQQIRYWYKWRNLHNDLGFQELLESAKADRGLSQAARLMIQVELDRLAELEQDGYELSLRDQTLRRQLRDLIKTAHLS